MTERLSPGIRLALLGMRLLARGRCYHCHSATSPRRRNLHGLWYCTSLAACEGRMAARGKLRDRYVLAVMREAFGEVSGG